MRPRTSRRFNIIVIIAVIVVVGLVILLLQTGHKRPTKTNSSDGAVTTKYDSNSGDTTRTIKGESPAVGTDQEAPIFLGVSNFISSGLSSNQLQNMENAFYTYSKVNQLHIKQVSISTNTITINILNEDSPDPINVFDFNVVFDDTTTVKAELQYTGLNNIELFLHDQTGKQLYDSGILDAAY